MTPELQAAAALTIVAIAVVGLTLRAVAKRKSPGCGSECACPTTKLKR